MGRERGSENDRVLPPAKRLSIDISLAAAFLAAPLGLQGVYGGAKRAGIVGGGAGVVPDPRDAVATPALHFLASRVAVLWRSLCRLGERDEDFRRSRRVVENRVRSGARSQ